ncbi:hypothetical protein [Halomonas sp. IOP_31]|uniref:hypothetical protein n=1 Tax=Halomonas sp. IOP_31 TaxID=2876584 RepID=UPI001E3E7111|nr:hypothetical protein [Halomonas sp. IOP_31]MCD6007626.1 hypothetical protein [Halomonas sp. IOP_31]
MPEVREGQLTFHFPEGWQLLKYDDSTWHRQRMKSRSKGVDILAHMGGPTHWWVEVKDCEGYEPENRPRLSAADPAEVSQARQWVEQQGLKPKVQVVRRKPFIVDEIEEKLRDTLAAIAVAEREAAPELAGFSPLHAPFPRLRIVLLLTWNQRDFKRLASRLQTRLERALAPYGVQGLVVNEQTTGSAGLHCRVTRSHASNA